MIRIAIVALIWVVMLVRADAQTYVATFTGGTLLPTNNDPGIPGVTKLKVILMSLTPFPSSFSGTWWGTFNFDDGVDSLKSLERKGYFLQQTNGADSPYVTYTLNQKNKFTYWTLVINMCTISPSCPAGSTEYSAVFNSAIEESFVQFDEGGGGTFYDVGTLGTAKLKATQEVEHYGTAIFCPSRLGGEFGGARQPVSYDLSAGK